MDEAIRARMDRIDALASEDGDYLRMFAEMVQVERRYESVLQTLNPRQQDAVCDFVSLCEEMNLRQLELACTHMQFPE